MLSNPLSVKSVATLGMGSVGSGWAALLLAKGIGVQAFDPGSEAREHATQLIRSAWPSLVELGLATHDAPAFDKIKFFETATEAVEGADVILESVPEDIALKHQVIRDVDAAAPLTVPILSSAGGISPTEMQSVCRHPDRFLVMHPFNPSHLIPLVEVVPGRDTSPEAVNWALEFARYLGKRPVTVKGELPGHMVNRLQFALVREAITCLRDGVATAEDIETAVRYGLAPRWMLQGGLQTVAMAGGQGGMSGILNHAGPAIEQWWTPRGELQIDDSVKSTMVEAARALSHGIEFKDWAAWRDTHLLALFGLQAQADALTPGNSSEEET